MSTTTIQPETLTLRAYQVGFGDCFLLTFQYPKRGAKSEFARHVLVDFGSSSLPKNAPADYLQRVANDIKKDCGGKLDAVVVTHRHLDHISGFTRKRGGKGTGDIIRALRPDVVVQPWTEDPKAQANALAPTAKNDPGMAYIRSLTNIQSFAASVVKEANSLQGKMGTRRLGQLAFLGEENIKNEDAVKNLMTMGKNAYVYHGSRSGLGKVLPGVKIHVLGPPTLEQSSSIRKQRAKDEDEFWQLQAAAGNRFTAGATRLFPRAAVYSKGQKHPPFARWLIPRMLALRADQLLEIVRILDAQMNNTSVILLLETKNRKLLFPGDAQLENWLYALKESPRANDLAPLLADVDLYKVGHHGSGNATPKSLWGLFKHRDSKSNPGRLQTILSTKAGKHNGVPQAELVSALEKNTNCVSTVNIKSSELKRVIGPISL